MPEKTLSKDKIEIRKVKESDLDAIMEIEVVSFAMPWSRNSYFQMMNVENVNFEAVVSEDQIVGYMLYQYWPDGAELHTIATNPECRNQGVGKLMMEHMVSWAKNNDMTRIFLQVRPSNSHALKLYEAFGFQGVARRKGYYTDDGEDAIIMAMKIDQLTE